MKRTLLSILAATLLLAACNHEQKTDNKMDRFINDLMSQMTLEEKIGQLTLMEGDEIFSGDREKEDYISQVRAGNVGGLLNVEGVANIREVQRIAVEESRLKIPMIFGLDVIHGYVTTFPIPLGMACSWDIEGIEGCARIAAQEATADGLCWTFSPMVDICHDARWGRIAEGAGEDPFLGSQIAAALVRGYQGDDLSKNNTMMACVKHFGLYGAAEGGRDYNTVDMSRWRMYNEYLPPYKAAVEAGAGSVMCSFNVVDGIPASGNSWLLTDLLRGQWHFPGFVVADYGSISDMEKHGIDSLPNLGPQCLNAGLDFDMCAGAYSNEIIGTAVKDGRVSLKTIDLACRRMLEAKYKLGLFDDPYRYCPDTTRAATEIYTESNRKAAREFAAKTFVLLKNDNNILPLKKESTIALIGPLADNQMNITGTWDWPSKCERYSTVRQRLEAAVEGKGRILYAKGCNFMYDSVQELVCARKRKYTRDPRNAQAMLSEALNVARSAQVVVVAVGETAEMSGEGGCRAHLELPDAQRDLLLALKKTGKPIVMLNFSGRPVILNWENENLDAILQVWFGGSEMGDAIADVLFGEVSPSGHLTTTFPRAEGQLPLYYAMYATGRPQGDTFRRYRSNYLDVENTGLFPFGYGLTYTTFEYSPITLSKEVMDSEAPIEVKCTVSNTGEYAAAEVVQLYIHDIFASTVRPMKELKGFERIYLQPGEKKEVTFKVTRDLLKFYNAEGQQVLEPGDFDIMVGPNSADLQTVRINVKG